MPASQSGRTRRILALVALVPLAVVPQVAADDRAAGPALFHYDNRLPLSVRIGARDRRGAAMVTELDFAIDAHDRLRGYLISPARARPTGAAILFVPGRHQTRDFFEPEALAVASRGVVALSVDDLAGSYPSFTRIDRAALIRRVVALRRAIDLLLTQPGVDGSRLGFVGHSDGAELGGVLAGIDRRVAAYVLMSGGGIWDRSGDPTYNRLVAEANADNYIGRAAPAALFFQSALSDQFVPRADALRYQRLGSRPKVARWYAADHMLNAQARTDRDAWLAARLDFPRH